MNEQKIISWYRPYKDVSYLETIDITFIYLFCLQAEGSESESGAGFRFLQMITMTKNIAVVACLRRTLNIW